jgi:hypothetical protein
MADGTQTFDDGSSIQTFEDGSTLVLDSEGTASSTPAPSDTDTSERKTTTENGAETAPSSTAQTTSPTAGTGLFNNKAGAGFLPATEKNILNNYRSWTYNFAIGALTPQALANTKLLAKDINTYQVLNSAGKGSAGLGVNTGGLNTKAVDYQESKTLVDGFNANSPGRFDMYIDNVEIDSVIGAGTPQGGSSIATNIRFEVFEPYSMGGFVEALQASAKAAGYADYVKATFGLRVQFQGWPDTSTNAQSTPEVVPMSTRYFGITLTGVEVDVSENGTRYRVGAVPSVQMALGATNVLTSDIKIEGDTVGEVLKNFFDAINKMVKDRTENEKDVAGRDTYEISCPKLSTVGSPQNTKAAILSSNTGTSYTSEIVKAKMADELTAVNVFKFADPKNYPNATVPGSTETGTKNPSTDKLNPKTGTVMFSNGAKIHDCIAAIIRDSHYTRDLLKPENLDKVKKGDGNITYFSVRLETDILKDDTENSKKFYNYRYVVEPYQMHYTRIPGQHLGKIDLKNIKGKIKREYNYIYTGKNVDVTKFNLKFNNLYFSAIPGMMGNRKELKGSTQSAGANQDVTIKTENSQAIADSKTDSPNSNATASVRTDPDAGNDFKSGARASQIQADPYARMAEVMHDAVLNNTDLIMGNLDILGDPYFLTTGGMGNGDIVLKDPMMTSDGQAPTTQGDVYINVNFKNPVDINPKTGLADFGVAPVSFSGVYRVTTLKNHFKSGLFTQSLDIVRIPGQILGKETEVLPASGKTSPLANAQVIKDTIAANILKFGVRPSDFNLENLLKRGLPNPGLPGVASKFTNAALDAVNSVNSTVGGVLNQVAGATGIVNNITNQLGVSPVGGTNALTSGVRLAASGLGALTAAPATAAAAITAAGNSVGNIAGIANAPAQLANTVAAQLGNVTQNAVAQGTALVQSVSNLAGGAASTVNGLIGDAKNAVANLQNTIPTDLDGVYTKLGIDPSVFSGLDPSVASKLKDQLVEAAKKVPENVDLGALKEQGISFANITFDKLKNIPAAMPKISAPAALTDPAYAEIAAKYGSVDTLLSGNTNLPNLTNINNVTNPLGTVSSAFGSLNAAKGAVSAANSYVNNTIANAAGVANDVGALAQNAANGLLPANIGGGSVESNIAVVANLTQNPTQEFNKLGTSVANQFGSLQSSPLAKLVQNNNVQGSV